MNNKKVLVIDFDADFLQTVSQFLRNEGFEVINAMDGMAGLEKFKDEEPGLVILEAMLPKLHGFELCSKITKDEKRVPVIIMTGVYKDPVYKTEALRTFGATAYFEKPFALDGLRTTIRRIFNISDVVSKKEEKKREDAVPSRAETVSSKHIEKPVVKPAEKPPVMDKHPLEKKKDIGKKGDDEVDRILKDALADFGLSPEKKKPVVKTADALHKEKPAPAQPVRPALSVAELARMSIKEMPANEMAAKETPHKEMPVREVPLKEPVGLEPVINEPIIREPVGNEPVVGEPMFEEPHVQPRAVEQPPIAEWTPPEYKEEAKPHKIEPQKKAPTKSLWDPFVEFYPDKKRPFSPRMIGIAAGVLIISSLAFYFLRPHKNPGQADLSGNAQGSESVSENPEAKSTLTSQQLLNTIEKMGQTQDEAKDAAVKNKQTAPPTEAPVVENARPEDLKPIPPTQNAQLQIPIPVPGQAGEAKTEARDLNAIPEAKQKEQATATETNAKASLGDLVPLDKVDSQPLIIRRIEPVYPPYAQTLKVEGQVTANALISEYGDVLQVNVTRGIEGNFGFERAAENAVKQWKFKPAQKDGVNVRVWKPFTIGFKLKK